MGTTTTGSIANSPTARKVVASLAILATAAAVAGMGTVGGFTDSTTPVRTTIQSGRLSINATQTGYPVPVSTAGFLPGDSLTRAVTLVNDGSTRFGGITFTSAATAGSILTTDTATGLRLSLRSCSVPWTQGGTASKPSYACSGTTRTLASGPAVTNVPLPTAAALNAGGVDYLAFSVYLPASADNTFQGNSATLSLSFTGVQGPGAAR